MLLHPIIIEVNRKPVNIIVSVLEWYITPERYWIIDNTVRKAIITQVRT